MLNGGSQSQNKRTSNVLLQRIVGMLPSYLCAPLFSSRLQPSIPNCVLSICACLETFPHPTSSLIQTLLLLSEEPFLIKDPCAGYRRLACHLLRTRPLGREQECINSTLQIIVVSYTERRRWILGTVAIAQSGKFLLCKDEATRSVLSAYTKQTGNSRSSACAVNPSAGR